MQATDIGQYSYDEFMQAARGFHGSPAPGLILGGYMVEEAKRHLPKDTIFDAISETSWCLPDAVQMLTLCTIGNGWLKVVNNGVYAISLFDKYTGEGVRVAIDPEKLSAYPEFRSWFFKLVPKREQDSDKLRQEIRKAGASVCSIEKISVSPKYLEHRSKGNIVVCPLCGDAYPGKYGGICRSCQGEAPYARWSGSREVATSAPSLRAIPVTEAVGEKAVHDMTRIIPGLKKGPAFLRGQEFEAGDICRLQRIGKNRVYVDDGTLGDEWVHEDDVARAFGEVMVGEGVKAASGPCEGKVNFKASRDGLFVADVDQLERFNLVPDVMVACRQSYTAVKKGTQLAGTRAIPLYMARPVFESAMRLLDEEPLFSVLPMRKAKVGILVTGDEIFNGLIQDKFAPIISGKVMEYGCEVKDVLIVPDDRSEVKKGVLSFVQAGCDLVVTTAGLSVDPDDVSRHGLMDAGVEDLLYGAPVLPGAMTLLARIGKTRIIGVPACGLFYKTTSFDLLLPRILADVPIRRRDLARMGHGAMCMECKKCTFPKCPFGK